MFSTAFYMLLTLCMTLLWNLLLELFANFHPYHDRLPLLISIYLYYRLHVRGLYGAEKVKVLAVFVLSHVVFLVTPTLTSRFDEKVFNTSTPTVTLINFRQL